MNGIILLAMTVAICLLAARNALVNYLEGLDLD